MLFLDSVGRLVAPSRITMLRLAALALVSSGPVAAQQFCSEQVVFNSQSDYVVALDVDQDGDLDAVTGSFDQPTLRWRPNLGFMSFGPSQSLVSSGFGMTDMHPADMDGDGDEDLLFAGASWLSYDRIGWFENLSGWQFGSFHEITDDVQTAFSIHPVDLDGDGDIDVLSASQTDGKIAWYENLGSGSFGSQIVLETTAYSGHSIYATDLDGDGDADVLLASSQLDRIAWYENLGAGSFGPPQVVSSSVDGALDVHASDLDGDGDADILAAAYADGEVIWFENLGGGAFSTKQLITLGVSPYSVESSDIDGDGDPDVLVTGRWNSSPIANSLFWLENDGAASFGPWQVLTTETGSLTPPFVRDLNGDADVDLLVTSYDHGSVDWFHNLGGGADCNCNCIADSIEIAAGALVDADANGIPDDCEGGLLASSFCVAAPNSVSPTGATIATSGSSSVALNDLVLTALQVPPNQTGLFVHAFDQRLEPLGNGFLCTWGSAVFVGPPMSANSAGVLTRAIDLTGPAGYMIAPGVTRNFQLWYRDPNGGPSGFNLSDGLEVCFY